VCFAGESYGPRTTKGPRAAAKKVSKSRARNLSRMVRLDLRFPSEDLKREETVDQVPEGPEKAGAAWFLGTDP